MNHRERFFKTAEFQPVDRVAVDYMANWRVTERLKKYLGVQTEREVLDTIGSDFFYLPSRDISQNEGFMKYYKGPALHMTETERICSLGIRFRRGAYTCKFLADEAIEGPLEEAETPADILKHRWPRREDFDFSGMLEDSEANSGRVIIGGLWTSLMGDSYRMIGYEKFLYSLLENPELMHTLVDKVTDTYLELNDKLFQTLKGKLDVWFFASDFGTQNGMMMRPAVWHDYFFENIKRSCALAHSYGLKVMMHSCGGIVPIIGWLIEAGVEMLDPIQTTARDMNEDVLADRFGGRIVFHGGIDTQNILPKGTREEVAEAVGHMKTVLGGKGGYICSPSQIFSDDVPNENIEAMYRAAGSWQG